MESFKSKKIKDIYQANFKKRAIFSFEFFPPKSSAAELQLRKAIGELKELGPDFISITCGAGASTRDETGKWSQGIQDEHGIITMSHYTSIGIQREDAGAHLRELEAAGIKNIMALRGDLPRGLPHSKALQNGFSYASELIAYIRQSDFDFSIGAACYPEVHMEAVSAEEDLKNLKKKVDAGADFLISQLFFINENYFSFLDRCHALQINLPIIPGLMPITNFKQIEKFTAMTGCKFPKKLLNNIEKCGDNKRDLYKLSLDHSLQQCQELLDQQVPGIHFYTLNQSDLTKEVFLRLR